MILIFSQNNELSTQKVIDWLQYYNKHWFRINEDDHVVIESIQIGITPEIKLSINDQILDLSKVQSYWYRRGWLNIPLGINVSCDDTLLEYNIKKHLREEAESLSTFLFWYLKTYKHSLSDFLDAENRKLIYLTCAQNAGLQIPPTMITGSPAVVKKQLLKQGRLITKSIHEVADFDHKNENVFFFTSEVDPKDIQNIQGHFFPSLFQKCIVKKVELRIFFLGIDLFPMAIFSQENEQTNLDFRDYDHSKPNRNVPFQIPSETTIKIQKFIELSGLNTGSIDMILTPEDEFIFLEVNPVGQFSMTSLPCNYFLEEKIAQYLIK